MGYKATWKESRLQQGKTIAAAKFLGVHYSNIAPEYSFLVVYEDGARDISTFSLLALSADEEQRNSVPYRELQQVLKAVSL